MALIPTVPEMTDDDREELHAALLVQDVNWLLYEVSQTLMTHEKVTAQFSAMVDFKAATSPQHVPAVTMKLEEHTPAVTMKQQDDTATIDFNSYMWV
eukprot:1777569-Rhodomonas_salina.3